MEYLFFESNKKACTKIKVDEQLYQLDPDLILAGFPTTDIPYPRLWTKYSPLPADHLSPMKPKPGHINIPDRHTDIKFLIKKCFSTLRVTDTPTDNTTLPIPFEKHNFPSTALSGCAKTSWCIFHNPSCHLLSSSPRSSTPLFRLLLNNHKIQPRWQHCNFVLSSFFFISRLVPRRNKRTDTESTSIKFPCCCPHTSDTFRVLFPRGHIHPER